MKLIKTTLIGSLLALSASANAELLNADWKIEGDGLAVYDTETGNTWLDFSVTNGTSINQIINDFDYLDNGWSFATHEQAADLTNKFFPLGFGAIQLFDYTENVTNSWLSMARSYENGEVLNNGIHYRATKYDFKYVNEVLNHTANTVHNSSGVMLVSNINNIVGIQGLSSAEFDDLKSASSVPLGSTALLLTVALAGFSTRGRKV